jgi:hypothetical protein
LVSFGVGSGAWQPKRDVQPITELNQPSPVMPAAELQLLVGDLCAELVPSSAHGERIVALAMLMERRRRLRISHAHRRCQCTACVGSEGVEVCDAGRRRSAGDIRRSQPLGKAGVYCGRPGFDFLVTVDGARDFVRRFAGKIETGQPGRTDPGMGPMRMTV